MKDSDRYFQLTDALRDTSGTNYFTVAERILIHQERAGILKKRSIGVVQKQMRFYKVPDKIERKIDKLNN